MITRRWAYLLLEPHRQTKFRRIRTPNCRPRSSFFDVEYLGFHGVYYNRFSVCPTRFCILHQEASSSVEVEPKSRDKKKVNGNACLPETLSCTLFVWESQDCTRRKSCRRAEGGKTDWNYKRWSTFGKGSGWALKVSALEGGIRVSGSGTMRGIIYAVQRNRRWPLPSTCGFLCTFHVVVVNE
jgi:hypothetical protein